MGAPPTSAGEGLPGALSPDEARRALQESEARYRTLFTNMTEGFALGEALCDERGVPTDFRFLEMNEAFERQAGLARETTRGRPMREVLPHLEQSWVDTYCGIALGAPARRFESYNADLERHFSVYCFSPSRGRFAILFTDVSEVRRAAERLQESEEKFRDLANNISQLAWMADASGSIGWYNARWFEYTGSTFEEMQGWGWQKVHHPDHVAAVTASFTAAIVSGEPWEDTFPLRGKDGRYRWFLSRALPIRGRDGRVVRWFGTNTDVTAQREAEEALRDSDRRKSEFLAVLSHELRNPLAAIHNAVTVLDRAPAGGERATRAVAVLRRQTAHLAALVDDLLDLTRISRGKVELERRRLDLREPVRSTVEDLRDLYDAAGVALSAELPPEPLPVEADAVRIVQVLGNLLHNAVKFTPRGGHVVAALREQGGAAELRVRDDGAGIDPEQVPRLFLAFEQAEQTLARSRGGLGLGLALVKALVELHGGTVSGHSEGPGRGAEFVVRLPLAAS